MKNAVSLLSLQLPWAIRRRVMQWVFKFDLQPTSCTNAINVPAAASPAVPNAREVVAF